MKTRIAACRRIFLPQLLFCLAGVACLFPAVLIGQITAPISALPETVVRARPGEIVIVPDGNYSDTVLSLSGTGERDRPITIRAATPGGVIFSGQSSLKVDGQFLVIDGFLFSNGFSPGKEVISISGTGCRLANCVIDNFNPPNPESKEEKWVGLTGRSHIVENCTFRNKQSKSATVAIWRKNNEPNEHIIRQNFFTSRPEGKESNGYETIRIGESATSASDSLTQVSQNLFLNCDGEAEIISVKSGKNLIKENTFTECAGTVTLRHGNGTRVEKNHFIGKNKAKTGGIRVYGSGHVISGNIAIGTAARDGGVISLQTGNPDPKPNEYHVARTILIEGNLMAANDGPVFKLDANHGENNRTELPSEIVIRTNVFSGADVNALISGAARMPSDAVIWDRNQIFRDNQIPKDITKSITPPLAVTDVGASWFRDKAE